VNYKKRKISISSDEEDNEDKFEGVSHNDKCFQQEPYEPDSYALAIVPSNQANLPHESVPSAHTIVPFEPSQSIVPYVRNPAEVCHRNLRKYTGEKRQKVTICKRFAKTKHRTTKKVIYNKNEQMKGNTQDDE
jgi:hypothetical protein